MQFPELQGVTKLGYLSHVKFGLISDGQVQDRNGANCVSSILEKFSEPSHILDPNIQPQFF